jgi:hypothetical protein
MIVTNCCVDYPCCILLLAMIFYAGMSLLALRMDYFVFNTQNERDYLVWSDEKVKTWDMRTATL